MAISDLTCYNRFLDDISTKLQNKPNLDNLRTIT